MSQGPGQLARDLEDHIVRKVPKFDALMSFFLRSQANARMFLDAVLPHLRQSFADSDKMLIVLTLINFFLDNIPDEYLPAFLTSGFYGAFKAHVYSLMEREEALPDIVFSHVINWQFVFPFSDDYKKFARDVEQFDQRADIGRVADLFSVRLTEWETAKRDFELLREQKDLDTMFETYEIMTINERLDILRKGQFSLQGELLQRYLAVKAYMDGRMWERLPPLARNDANLRGRRLGLDELYAANLEYRDRLKKDIEALRAGLAENLLLN